MPDFPSAISLVSEPDPSGSETTISAVQLGEQRVSHDLQLFCPRANTNSFLLSFVCNSVKAWNSLPYDIVHARSVQIFKCRLKQHLGM